MHPVIMEQLTADHIREMHAKAEDERLARLARQARRPRGQGFRPAGSSVTTIPAWTEPLLFGLVQAAVVSRSGG
jgi:hypothetical protein